MPEPYAAFSGRQLIFTLAEIILFMDNSTLFGNIFGLLFGAFFLIMPLVFLALMAFWIWILVDFLTKDPIQGNDKLVWLLVIILTNWIGALIYYFVRRPHRLDDRLYVPPELPKT